MPKVIVLGGGIAGLTAAHELAVRGFTVEVYEKNRICGGKARSFLSPEGMPGEHGFRFFPGFYKHIPDTMSRIPYGNQRNGVFDNLVSAERAVILQEDTRHFVFPARFPQTFRDLTEDLTGLFIFGGLNIRSWELMSFVRKLLIIMTSCRERRIAEYDNIPWLEFLNVGNKSEQFNKLIAKGITRLLVAMRAEEASTRTVGTILIQILGDILTPGDTADRVLNGPTNDVWIDPWVKYLERRNVKFVNKANVTQLHCKGHRISSVTIKRNDVDHDIKGNYYVLAVPVEVVQRQLLTQEIKTAAPSLSNIGELDTEWMNGIQFYLSRDVSTVRGHTIYADSRWALTSLSQREFWREDFMKFDPNVRGIVSVDISDWVTKGNKKVFKAARDCTLHEIKEEVWAQLKAHLQGTPTDQLLDDDRVESFLDPAIALVDASRARGLCKVRQFCQIQQELGQADGELGASVVSNAEPLLINTCGSWKHRPEATTEIENLFLAADYVRTHTDLATMEGANEAARRAVNGILERSGWKTDRCGVWELEELAALDRFRKRDKWRFDRGLPHTLTPRVPADVVRSVSVMIQRLLRL
jgi:15-cis-phytoene desaturase